MQNLGTLSIIVFICLTVGLLTERYFLKKRIKKHRNAATNDRFDTLVDKLYRCETNEDLAELRQSMLFTLCVEDYMDSRYDQLVFDLAKQEAAINNDFLTLKQIRIKEGNKMLGLCSN